MKVSKRREKVCDGITKMRSDGTNLYIATISDSLFVYDKNYTKIRALNIESGTTDLTLNKNILAANSFSNNISVFDINNLGQKTVQITVNECESWKIALSEKNNEIVTGGASGKITKYDLETGELRNQLQIFQDDFLTDLIYTPSNNILMSSKSGKLAMISENFDNLQRVEIELHKNIRSLHSCNDFNKVCIVSDDCKIYFFDLQKQVFLSESIFEGHTSLITDLCFKEGESVFYTCSLDGSVKFWDEKSGFIDNVFLEEDDQPWSVCYLRENDDLVVGLEDGAFLVFDSK